MRPGIGGDMSNIIGSVRVTPPTPRPGESVLVEVCDADGVPLADPAAAVTIAAVPGAVQHLQFPTEGTRTLGITARGPDGPERTDAEIVVAGAPVTFTGAHGTAEVAMVGVTQSQVSPYTAVLTLGSTADVRAVSRLRPFRPIAGGLRFVGAATAARRTAAASPLERLIASSAALAVESGTGGAGDVAGTTFVAEKVDVTRWKDLLRTRQQTFTWDFGDGTSATTETPVVSHDYFAAIDHGSGVGTFDVTVRVTPGDIEVRRTLTIYSAYALSRRAGTIVAHTTGDLFAHKKYTQLSGSFVVHNVEDAPLVLDRMSVTAYAADPDAAAVPRPFRQLAHAIQIPARGATSIGVNVPFVEGRPDAGELPYDARGFTVIYAGTAGGVPVRCSFSFDIPVEEWDDRPHFPELPELPPLVRKVWPWEMVEDWWRQELGRLEELINPADIVLDTVTGTVAIPLDALAGVSVRQAELAVNTVLSGVFAPVQTRALAADQLDVPATRRLTPRLGGLVGSATERRIGAARNAATRGSAGTRGPGGQVDARGIAVERERATGIAVGRDAGTRLDAGRAAVLNTASVLDNARAFAGLFAERTFHTLEGEFPGPPDVGPILEGAVCDPDNLTEEELALAENGQLVCQLTDEVVDVMMPARWMNARRGDVILSPGGDGLIGGLMLRVSPPQLYSHSGIMTRNFDEIAHSTGSQDRLMDHQVGFTSEGSDGFDPPILKWMWPGAIRQSVQDSVEGQLFPDPDFAGKNYRITAFGTQTVGITHNDKMVMIPPLVLKPDPLLETPQVRSTLHAIAAAARADAGIPGTKGKYHYRFFCYTDPSIGLENGHDPGVGWAVGTRASVCSSFIWMKVREHVQLEGTNELLIPSDLEQKDVDAGASVGPTTIDGLYRYTAAERLNAGEWLYEHIYDMAYEKAGWFGTLLTDAPDDIANQFLNVFASDDADGKDSEEWRNTQDANAVSPDDMIWWDGPEKGGVYGFVEPAIFREPRVETYTVSRWKKVITRGRVHGRVLAGGAAAGGASVSLYGDKTAISAADGTFSIENVPLGDYLLKASKVIDGAYHSVQLPIKLTSDDLSVDVVLQPPDERFRLAQVFIDFRGVDEEDFGDDEILDPGPEYFELELSPSKLSNSKTKTYTWGGEVRAVYTITTKLLVGNIIDVVVNGRLYEGASEDTDDLDGQGSLAFQVPPGGTGGAVLRITNTDEDDDDEGRLSISVTNARNDN